MGDRGGYQRGTRVYVGGLSQGTKKEDLESEFEKFGKLNNVWVAFNPPGFAFIEFSSKADAENACYSMNGTELMGGKLRVELSRSRGRGGFRGNENGGGRGRGGPRGGQGPPGMDFAGRGGRGGSRPFGAPRGGGPPRRGGFARGRVLNGARDGDYGAGVGDGAGGPANGTFGFHRNSYDEGADGAASRYRSRSPIGAGGGGGGGGFGLNRRY